ncbi:MAG: hypothetical protein JW955_13420 [Sedimentisphaerales bacterium]|nr:hypothetical protein [Sedimentisphaerales bacterium]
MVDEMKPVHPVAPWPRWPFTRRQIIAQIVVAGVILASGIGIGVGGTILTLNDKIMWRPPVPPGRDAGMRGPFGPDGIVKEWTANYSLTDEQAQQVKDTLTKQFEAARSLWIEFGDRNKAERDKLVEAMRGILTAEQFGRWEPDFTERTRHFDQWRPGGPGGPGRPGGRGRPGGPGEFGGPDKRRGEHGPRGMRGMEPPPDGAPPEGPPPQQVK